MSFVDDHLMEGKTVQYRTKLHWIFFFWPILWLIIAIVIAILGESDPAKYFGAIIGFFSLLSLVNLINELAGHISG